MEHLLPNLQCGGGGDNSSGEARVQMGHPQDAEGKSERTAVERKTVRPVWLPLPALLLPSRVSPEQTAPPWGWPFRHLQRVLRRP